MTTILCKQGYLIPIVKELKNLINVIKNELIVEPFSPYNFSFLKKEDKSFIIYKEITLSNFFSSTLDKTIVLENLLDNL